MTSLPNGGWLTAACYALIALAPIPGYYLFRPHPGLAEEQWARSTPFDAYLGVTVLYLGSAGACSYLLLRRRALAFWPAAFVALWATLTSVATLRALLQGKLNHPVRDVAVALARAGLLVLLAFYVRKLRRQGVLR